MGGAVGKTGRYAPSVCDRLLSATRATYRAARNSHAVGRVLNSLLGWRTRLYVATLAVLLASACGGVHVKASPEMGPDMSGVLRVSTRFSLAHACPISPTMALTSAHVVDPRPYDQNAPVFAGRWSTEFGSSGELLPPIRTAMDRDLATVSGSFPKWFPIAEKAPGPGTPVYALGWEFRNSKDALGDRKYKLEVVRAVAGLLVMRDADPQQGSSGGCVLNALGEVVAIIDSGWDMESGEKVIVGVAVWGEKFENPVLVIE